MAKQELQKVYFDLYDKLPSPISQMAKDNWDYEFAAKRELPQNLRNAMYNGFSHDKTKQGYQFWDIVSRKIHGISNFIEILRPAIIAEYKASLNPTYTPEQVGQRGPDDFNFNPLIPESII